MDVEVSSQPSSIRRSSSAVLPCRHSTKMRLSLEKRGKIFFAEETTAAPEKSEKRRQFVGRVLAPGPVVAAQPAVVAPLGQCPGGPSLPIECDPKRPWPQCPPQSYCYATNSVDIGPYFCCPICKCIPQLSLFVSLSLSGPAVGEKWPSCTFVEASSAVYRKEKLGREREREGD